MKAFKVVYKSAVGLGLFLSEEAVKWLEERDFAFHIKPEEYLDCYSIPRHHPLLVECVETLGASASGCYYGDTMSKADLRVATIIGKHYYIDEHDGAGEEVIDIGKMVDASVI